MFIYLYFSIPCLCKCNKPLLARYMQCFSDMPVMGTQSTSRMKLQQVKPADPYIMTQTRADLLETNLEAGPVSELHTYNKEAEVLSVQNTLC